MRARRGWRDTLSLLGVLGFSLLSGCTLAFPRDVDGGSALCRDDRGCSPELPLCRQGRCVSRCAGVVCGGDGSERCDPGQGRCVPYLGDSCVIDANCPEADQRCVDGHCAADRLASCASIPCAPGLGCVIVRGDERCLQPCERERCRVGERCLDASFGRLASYCAPNLCRPGGGPQDRLVRSASYGDACEIDGAGVGTCLGPLVDARLGDVGVCVAFGEAAPGSSCDPAAAPGSALACREGVCASDPVTGEPTCFALCLAWPAAAGAACTATQACWPQWGGLGVCLELLPGAAAAGEACRLPVDGQALSCQAGSVCLSADLQGAPRQCLPICDPEVPVGEVNACRSGVCVRWDPIENPFLGVCVGG